MSAGTSDLWQEYCTVEAGGISATAKGEDPDLDIEASVSHGGDEETPTFDVTIWNLAKDSWANIQQGDPCRVRLGWALEGPSPRTVCIGRVEQRYPDADGADTLYHIKGQDESQARLDIGISETWQNRSPDAIAKFIADKVGLGYGQFDAVGSPIPCYWAIKKDRPVRHWLQKLTDEAGKLTGDNWTVYATGGKLYFKKKETATETAVNINSENAISVDRASGQSEKTEGGDEIKFEAYLDPRIVKDSLLNVEMGEHSGIYKVTSYEYRSSTISGDHLVSGNAAPADAGYRVTYPGIAGNITGSF